MNAFALLEIFIHDLSSLCPLILGFGMLSSESKGRRAAAQSAQSEGSSSSELDDQIEKDRYLSSVSAQTFPGSGTKKISFAP